VSLVDTAPPAPAVEPSPPPPQPVSTSEPIPEPTPQPEMTPPPPEPEQTPLPDVAPDSSPAPSVAPTTPRPHPHVTHSSNSNTRPAASAAPQTAAAHPGAATGPIGTAVRYRSNPRPEYPAAARHLGQEGVVLLGVEVEPDGRPGAVSVKRSSGFPLLDEAAVRAVKQWTFEPKTVASIPVASSVDVPIRFSLSE
jgi:periplasmic protein TonB